MRKYSVRELLKATGGRLLFGDENNVINHVATDSRMVTPEHGFFAMVGEERDGHDFLESALEKGCVTFFVSKEEKLPEPVISGSETGLNVILVDDTLKALQGLAKDYLSRLPLKKKIAVTGSVGKTSTRDMLYYICSTTYKTGRNPKNFNNWVGMPLSILDFPEDTEIAILEMGMSGSGQIKNLVDIAHPDVGLITNVGISHIERLGSRENILKAKLEITANFDENSVLIVNRDNDMLTEENTAGIYEVIGVGKGEGCEYRVSDIKDLGENGVEYRLTHEGKEYLIKLPIPGAHNAINGTLAIAAGNLLGITVEKAMEGLSAVKLTDNRLNIKESRGIKVIDDSYNACPESMKSAINTLMAMEKPLEGRRVAILGDIFEIGDMSESAHRDIGRYVGENKVDLLIAIGEKAAFYAAEAEKLLSKEKVVYFTDTEAAKAAVPPMLKGGDTVLIKASNGMKLGEISKIILG